jgi:predicted DNA-binding protein
MPDDPKEPVNFRLGRSYKEALDRLAAEQARPAAQLVREAVERYVREQARAAWEAEARRQAAEIAEAVQRPGSDEAEMARFLDANLEDFAKEWVWDEDES